MPEVWRKRADNVKQGSSEEAVDFPWASDVRDSAHEAYWLYRDMLEQGVCPEQARVVLPQNTMTEWIWSGSLGAFADMCRLRLDSHSQQETRVVATKIAEQMQLIYPISWAALMEGKQ